MKKLSYLLVLSVLFVYCKPEPSGPDFSIAMDSTDIVVEKVREDSHVPGIAVAVMIDGEMVYSKGYGWADMENQVPVRPDSTLFRIGSVSKSFTSLALGRLYEEGRLDLDASVQTYVPYFPEKKYPITVRQVAGHIAGIRHYRGNENLSDKNYSTVEEGIEIFSQDSLLFEPGTNYRYSSYGWNLLSAVVEGASGQDFLTYMRNDILDPLGLSNIRADFATEDIPGRTKFYYYAGDSDGIQEAPYVDNSYKWAGGGYIATCEDMVRFGNYMLEPVLISPETVEVLVQSQTINDTTQTNYGIGWRSQERDGRNWFGHSGGSVGGITQLVIYPESGVVVGLTSNSSDVDYQGIQHKIAGWFIDSKLVP